MGETFSGKSSKSFILKNGRDDNIYACTEALLIGSTGFAYPLFFSNVKNLNKTQREQYPVPNTVVRS